MQAQSQAQKAGGLRGFLLSRRQTSWYRQVSDRPQAHRCREYQLTCRNAELKGSNSMLPQRASSLVLTQVEVG